MQESKVIDVTTTDLPHYDQLMKLPEYFAEEKGEKGTVVWLYPDEAIAKGAAIHGVSIERELWLVEQSVVDAYAKEMKAGKKFPLPVLDYKRSDQEGRHRILAAKQAGEEKVPVLIVEEVTQPKPPAANPGIKHKGTEPEGIAIADELGLSYDGIQKDPYVGMQFTDVEQTGTTFYANTLEEARTGLAEKRKLWAEVSRGPEVTKLTGDIWDTMTPIERDQLGVKAKLDAERRGERWIGLFGEEKRALIREYKKEQLAKPPEMTPVEYDRRYSLEELREKAKQAGLSASGSKKEIAARLIAENIW